MTHPSADQFVRLHDFIIRVHCEHAALRRHVMEILRFKGAQRTRRSAATVDIDLLFATGSIDDTPLPGAEAVGPFGPSLEIWRVGTTFLLSGPTERIEIYPENGRVLGCFSLKVLDRSNEDDVRQMIYYPLIFGLSTLLRQRGLYGLHAAAVAVEDAGILIVGPSDSGKSTSALALISQGWLHVSDDAVLLREREEIVEALSFRRDFSLDPEAAASWPTITNRTWPRSPSDPTKYRVDVTRLFASPFQETCVPRLIVVPSVTRKAESRLIPVDGRGAFPHLFAQSAVMVTPVREWIVAHLRILGTLLSQATAYRLEAGRDVLENPARLSRLLEDRLNAV